MTRDGAALASALAFLEHPANLPVWVKDSPISVPFVQEEEVEVHEEGEEAPEKRRKAGVAGTNGLPGSREELSLRQLCGERPVL